jgi:predicted nucleic acid-binding protein
MTGASADERALADTNIVVYSYDPADPVKHQVAKDLLRQLSDAGRLVFSTQVLNEFCSVMMRPSSPVALTAAQVAVAIRRLAATGDVVPITAATTLLALDAMPRHALSFWDALIWAAAKENGVPVIYSEDFQDGRDVEGVRFVNPFLAGS